MADKTREQRSTELRAKMSSLKGMEEIDRLARQAVGKPPGEPWPPDVQANKKIKMILDVEFPPQQQ